MPARQIRLLLGVSMGVAAAIASAQPSVSLGAYFGFDSPRYLVVDDGAGPMLAADFDGDGLVDLAVVNNRKSRIELYIQRSRPLTDGEIERSIRVNELPPSRWYEQRNVSVAHRVGAFDTLDFDGDGLLDIVYGGSPAEIVLLRQAPVGEFELVSRKRVRGLGASRTAFAVVDVMGGASPEVVTIANGRISVFPVSGSGAIGAPVRLGSDAAQQQIAAFFCEDYDGDGLTDILGVTNDGETPMRLWRQMHSPGASVAKNGMLGPEIRFVSPLLLEVEPVRFPGKRACSIGVIESATQRMVFYDLVDRKVSAGEAGGSGELQAEVYPLPAGERAAVLADVDGDGRTDLIAADREGNQVVVRLQRDEIGLASSARYSAFKEPGGVDAGQWDGTGSLEIFVLSEEEKAVGVCSYDAGRGLLSFPQPLRLASDDATPIAMSYVSMEDGPALAVVTKRKRTHTLQLVRPGGERPAAIELEGVKRSPASILSADLDHDGAMDLLLLTPGEPIVVVAGAGLDEPVVLTEEDMSQFGLVKAAGPDNTVLRDVDGDGTPELIIADENFVRACSFSRESGWRVVDQFTLPDSGASLVGLTAMDDSDSPAGFSLAVYNKADSSVVTISPEPGAWRAGATHELTGFVAEALHAGSFTGGGSADLLAFGSDGFAVVRLEGTRAAIESFAVHRTNNDRRYEHEMSVGDVNGDGRVDVIVLDASEQMCEILSFSESRNIFPASEFKVFETRLFAGGDSREYQPSDALVADLTGDGAADMALLVHDRVIVYPQMTSP